MKKVSLEEVDEAIRKSMIISREADDAISREPPSARFNSLHHSREEIEVALPGLPHTFPPRELYNYSNYLSVIAASRKMSPKIIPIPRILNDMIERCFGAFHHVGGMRQSLVEEICETWPALVKHFRDNTTAKYFIRLEESSPKDSPVLPGAVSCAEDVVKKICTSMRAKVAMEYAGHINATEKVILLPWDERMDSAKEFRCFVPPNDTLRITAISQYRWHAHFAGWDYLGVEAPDLGEHAKVLLQHIIHHSHSDGTLQQLRQYGLSFDIAAIDGDVQLVEVNPFGAMSGCGSCLFHWLDDAKLLYGMEDEIELRVTDSSA